MQAFQLALDLNRDKVVERLYNRFDGVMLGVVKVLALWGGRGVADALVDLLTGAVVF